MAKTRRVLRLSGLGICLIQWHLCLHLDYVLYAYARELSEIVYAIDEHHEIFFSIVRPLRTSPSKPSMLTPSSRQRIAGESLNT